MTINAAPSPSPQQSVRPPFAFAEEGDEFEKQFGQEVIKRLWQSLLGQIPERNLQHYSHGSRWSHATSTGPAESKFAPRSVEVATKISDIVGGNLGALTRSIEEMAESFERLQQRDLAQTVHASAVQAGNVVSAKTERELYLGLLRTVDYGVGPNGQVTQPELWVGSPGFKEKVDELFVTDPMFRSEVERLIAQKKAEAFERETLRKARFQKPQ